MIWFAAVMLMRIVLVLVISLCLAEGTQLHRLRSQARNAAVEARRAAAAVVSGVMLV